MVKLNLIRIEHGDKHMTEQNRLPFNAYLYPALTIGLSGLVAFLLFMAFISPGGVRLFDFPHVLLFEIGCYLLLIAMASFHLARNLRR